MSADLQWALKLEPNNEAVKAELARVDALIVNRKGKTVRPSTRLCRIPYAPLLRFSHIFGQRSAPIELPAPFSSPAAPPKRRRVPITIVDDDNNHPPNVTQPTGSSDDLLLNPISSRVLPPDGKTAPPAPAAPKPTPASFREAKQVREAKSAGRVGGGIFRMSGNDTVFKTRDVPVSAAVDPPKDPTRAPASTHTAPATTRAPSAAPRTLFEFTRAWDSVPSSDTGTRWALLNVLRAPLSPVFLSLTAFFTIGLAVDPPHIPPSALRLLARTRPPRLAGLRARHYHHRRRFHGPRQSPVS